MSNEVNSAKISMLIDAQKEFKNDFTSYMNRLTETNENIGKSIVRLEEKSIQYQQESERTNKRQDQHEVDFQRFQKEVMTMLMDLVKRVDKNSTIQSWTLTGYGAIFGFGVTLLGFYLRHKFGW